MIRLLLSIALTLLLAACSSTPDRVPTLGSGKHTAQGDKVALHAMSFIGKPYQWGGSSPRVGFDCSGLAWFVYRESLGITLPRRSTSMGRVGRKVSRSRLQAGDLVFFNTNRRRNSHVGIYIGNGRFVHAPSSGKSIRITKLSNPYWHRRFDGARRPR